MWSLVSNQDIRCVLGAANKYFIKEMSIVDTETWATKNWILKNSITMQDNNSRKANKWLECKYVTINNYL